MGNLEDIFKFYESAKKIFADFQSIPPEHIEYVFDELFQTGIQALDNAFSKTSDIRKYFSLCFFCIDRFGNDQFCRPGAIEFVKWVIFRQKEIASVYGKINFYSNKAIFINEAKSHNLNLDILPRARYFLRWFPYPHIHAVPLEGFLETSLEDIYKAIWEVGEGKLIRYLMNSFHVFLSFGVLPYYKDGKLLAMTSELKNVALCESLFNPEKRNNISFLEKESGSEIIKLCKEVGDVLKRWASVGIIYGKNFYISDVKTVKTRNIAPKFKKMVEEDILIWHDVLVSVLLTNGNSYTSDEFLIIAGMDAEKQRTKNIRKQ